MNTMSYHERTCRYLITECLMSTSSLSESQFSDDWKEMIHFYSTGYASWVIIEIFELWSWEIMELVSYQSLCVGVFMPTWCLQTSRSFPWTWSEDVILVFIYTLKSTIPNAVGERQSVKNSGRLNKHLWFSCGNMCSPLSAMLCLKVIEALVVHR